MAASYKDLDELFRRSIEDYDEKVSIALGYMDRMRCPLRLVGGGLYEEICGVLEDNGIVYDEDLIEEIISC